MKNDMPSDFAGYRYKVKDAELPFTALLISFIAIEECMYCNSLF